MIDLDLFISNYVTRRNRSMFGDDVEINQEQLKLQIEGRTVLVIGGAGTIGSSFIRAILPFQPSSLVVVDINENGLTELTRDLRSGGGFVPQNYVTYPMNYADSVFEKMFRSHGGFDIVANFSAHKHVRSEKDAFSVEALLENNVLRARRLLELVKEYPAQHFFCVSTDKAANPVNIMGGSKKIMEEMIMAYKEFYPITTARFANVAFSNGSLPAGFVERVGKRQPLSAPSDVTRYFVSPDESGEICMLACILGRSGEIFFPKLGQEQVMTFAQIARLFLNELGYDVVECQSELEAIEYSRTLSDDSKQYPVYFFNSDTTGEKPYEEFFTDRESVDMARYKALGVVRPVAARPMADIDCLFDKLRAEFSLPSTDKGRIVAIMKEFLHDFDHQELGKNLDSKM